MGNQPRDPKVRLPTTALGGQDYLGFPVDNEGAGKLAQTPLDYFFLKVSTSYNRKNVEILVGQQGQMTNVLNTQIIRKVVVSYGGDYSWN